MNFPIGLVELGGGDWGFGASRTIDIEVWLPGQNRYREISSISNTKEISKLEEQRLDIEMGRKNRLGSHHLNGSGLVVGENLIAIMGNFQRRTMGRLGIPEVLNRFCSKAK